MISLIYATDKNNLIGKNNDLPWYYPSDLKYFKEKTLNKKVVMGMKTFQSILDRLSYPLPSRENIIVTRDKFFKYPECLVINDLDSFLEQNKNTSEEIFVIGGKQIYEASIKYASKIYLTYIDKEYHGDTYLNLDLKDFKLIKETVESELYFREYQRN